MPDVMIVVLYTLLFVALYFEVFLLITFLEWRAAERRKRSEVAVQDTYVKCPTVTIIVPCFNEEKTAGETLRSLLSLEYPKEKLSIIAVDDGSTDDTWSVLQEFAGHPRVSVYTKANDGKHSALNLGLSHTASELVGCLDADSFVDPDALREIVCRFKNPRIMAVTPAIKVYRPRTFVQHIQKAEYSFSIFIRRAFSHINTLFITPGPFSIFRTEFFRKHGGYRKAHHTEDLEIALRVHSRGYRIDNAHTALVYTTVPDTLRKLFAQRLRWTHGFIKNAIDYRHLFFSRKHAHLGLLVLPLVAISLFSALYFAGVLMFSAASRIAEKVIEVQIVGAPAFFFVFDPFFINTKATIFLVFALMALACGFIVIGKQLSGDKRAWSPDILFYLFLYGFIAPLWLTASVYRAAFSKNTKW